MRGLITVAICALALATGCNQKSERKKDGNNGTNNNTFNTTPNTTIPTTTTPTNTLLNGRNCSSNELVGSGTKRIVITAQPGVHQVSQMQIVSDNGQSQTYNLQPDSKFLLMPRSDNYAVTVANGTGYNTNYNNPNTFNNNQGTNGGGVFGGLFGGNNGGVSSDAGHVTVAPSGNVYLRGVEFYDNSSGTVEAKKLTAKATCTI